MPWMDSPSLVTEVKRAMTVIRERVRANIMSTMRALLAVNAKGPNETMARETSPGQGNKACKIAVNSRSGTRGLTPLRRKSGRTPAARPIERAATNGRRAPAYEREAMPDAMRAMSQVLGRRRHSVDIRAPRPVLANRDVAEKLYPLHAGTPAQIAAASLTSSSGRSPRSKPRASSSIATSQAKGLLIPQAESKRS